MKAINGGKDVLAEMKRKQAADEFSYEAFGVNPYLMLHSFSHNGGDARREVSAMEVEGVGCVLRTIDMVINEKADEFGDFTNSEIVHHFTSVFVPGVEIAEWLDDNGDIINRSLEKIA